MISAHVSDHRDLGSASQQQGRVQEPPKVGVTVFVPLNSRQLKIQNVEVPTAPVLTKGWPGVFNNKILF